MFSFWTSASDSLIWLSAPSLRCLLIGPTEQIVDHRHPLPRIGWESGRLLAGHRGKGVEKAEKLKEQRERKRKKEGIPANYTDLYTITGRPWWCEVGGGGGLITETK